MKLDITKEKYAVELENVGKKFGKRWVLKDINLQVLVGRFLTFLGKNGSGKTTLLSLIASVIKPNTGRIFIFSRDIFSDSSIRQMIGFVSHQSFCYPRLTAMENLRFYASIYGIKMESGAHINFLLQSLGLLEVKNELVQSFSRGMVQRLSIARALLASPPLLLLDEPFTSLDEQAVQILKALLKSLQSSGTTILMTTHDLELAYQLSDEIAVLFQRNIISLGSKSSAPLDELRNKYLSLIDNNL